jgi:hypothetical protein
MLYCDCLKAGDLVIHAVDEDVLGSMGTGYEIGVYETIRDMNMDRINAIRSLHSLLE